MSALRQYAAVDGDGLDGVSLVRQRLEQRNAPLTSSWLYSFTL
jgi:hypothetical protein